MEVERAKGRGCLTRSVKLAQLARYCSFSAEAMTIARSAAPPAREWSEPGSRDIDHTTRGATVREREVNESNRSELHACPRRAHSQLPGGEGGHEQGKEGEPKEVIPNS